MPDITSVCVFCGSRTGNKPIWKKTAADLGKGLAERNMTLVYGGGRIGIMGEIATNAKANGGYVVGVIPEFLEQAEVGNKNCDELIIVDSMHERKDLMARRSDAFVVMPGGIGSLEEFFEILTWRTLKLHNKPIIVVDIDGCWTQLVSLIDSLITDGFAGTSTRDAMEVVTSVEGLFTCLQNATSDKLFDAAKT